MKWRNSQHKYFVCAITHNHTHTACAITPNTMEHSSHNVKVCKTFSLAVPCAFHTSSLEAT